jgi:hypothetical protein
MAPDEEPAIQTQSWIEVELVVLFVVLDQLPNFGHVGLC